MSEKKIKDIVILYHGSCFDGFGGAWAAWKHFGDKASYIALHRQNPPPLYLKNKTLYFIDFVYSPALTKKFIAQNKRVTAIDHHVSGEKATRTTEKSLYALHHSGAVLAWKYFHPIRRRSPHGGRSRASGRAASNGMNHSKPVPRLLRHIEDQDLWKFCVPHTKEVAQVLALREFEFRAWDRFMKELENSKKRRALIKNGALLLKYHDELVGRLMPNAERVCFEGYTAYALNSPDFISEAGNLLAKKLPPIAIIWNRSKGSVRVSLRSDGSVNVAKIAEKYGGGGHKAAAGFVVKSEKKLPWKYVSDKRHMSGVKKK